MNYGLLILWIFPILAGIIGFIRGNKSEQARNDWIDIAMFVELVLLVCMGVEYAKGWKLELALDGAFGVGFYMVMDRVRLMMCFSVAVIFAVVSQFMKWSLSGKKGMNRFYLCYMGVFGAVIGAICSVTFLNLIMFLMAAYLLMLPMMLQRKDVESEKNSRWYVAYTAAAYSLIVAGVLIIVAKLGSAGYAFLYYQTSEYKVSNIVSVGGVLAMIGFGIFAGMFPLQSQVARTNRNSLMELSVLVSTVLSKLSVLALFLMARALFAANKTVGEVILIWALATAIWGIVGTLTSTDIRRMLNGLNLSTNAVIAMAGAVSLLGGTEGSLTLRSVLYLTVSASLSLMVLYMVALELVRKIDTYEIKGLIASGKGHTLLMAAAFLACASLIGIPGTMGFLGQGILVKSIYAIVRWKWLVVVCVLHWGFYITAVSRVFMKLFVSTKDEAMRILSSEEELSASFKSKEPADPKNVYRFGEVCLVLVGVVQIVVGALPFLTVSRLNTEIDEYFGNVMPLESIAFYTKDSLVIFVIAALLGVFFYVNLVHGVMLRSTKEKKNRKMKKELKIEDES